MRCSTRRASFAISKRRSTPTGRPAGRAAVLSLEGLGLAEIQAAAAGVELPGLLLRGAFPELWSQPAINAGDFQRSYVNTYLERDRRSLQQVGNLLQFERFLRACALRSGQLLNRAELARDGGPHPGVPRTTPLPPG